MELKGKPGEDVWVKATVNFVQIGLEGVSYFVDIEGQLVQFPASAVMAVSVLDDPETVKREEPRVEPVVRLAIDEHQDEPEEEPEEAPAPRRRGRPKKATVEGLMAKAEQAKIRREAEEGPLWVENDT